MSAWTVIAHTEVGSGGIAEIEFTSISGSYTDLKLVVSDRSNRSLQNDGVLIKLNGTNISRRWLYGNGSSPASGTADFDSLNTANTATANTFSNYEIYIPNYASTTTNKSVSIDAVAENNATEGYQLIAAGLYSSNTAVTSIALDLLIGTLFLQYSSATLYGITKGSSGGVTVS